MLLIKVYHLVIYFSNSLVNSKSRIFTKGYETAMALRKLWLIQNRHSEEYFLRQGTSMCTSRDPSLRSA